MSKIKKTLIPISIILLTFSLVKLTENFLRDYNQQKQIKALAQLMESATTESETGGGLGAPPPSTKIAEPLEPLEPVMLPEFQELYKRNSDIIGWLTIDNTRIDYPVMQNRQDGEYYLNHDFDKRKNKSGLPFLDINSRINDSDILMIHGHYMRNGSIFADLWKYKKESYYKEHDTFQFSTLYEKEEYEIVAVILSKVYRQSDDVFKYYQIDQLETPDEFDSYIQNLKELALYDTGITAQYGDKLIVLSTCEYSTANGRLAVVARKRT